MSCLLLYNLLVKKLLFVDTRDGLYVLIHIDFLCKPLVVARFLQYHALCLILACRMRGFRARHHFGPGVRDVASG